MLRSSWVCWLMFALRLCMVLAVRPRASARTQQLLLPLCPVVPLLACDLGWNWHRGSSKHHTPTLAALHLLAATRPYGVATATHSPLCVSAGDDGLNTVQLPTTEPSKGWAASWDHAQCPITVATAVPTSSALQTLQALPGIRYIQEGYVLQGASHSCIKVGSGILPGWFRGSCHIRKDE